MPEYRGKQNGSVVFGVSGDDVFSEAVSYACKYVSEGGVSIEEKRGRKWVAIASIVKASSLKDDMTLSL